MPQPLEILLMPEGGLRAEEVKRHLEKFEGWDPRITLEIRRSPNAVLSPDLDFIRATVPYATAAVLALIKAIADVRKAKNTTEVTVETPDGKKWKFKGTVGVEHAQELLAEATREAIIKV